MSRCYHCFKEYSQYSKICPYCGEKSSTKAAEPVYLAPGTVLAGRFIIGESIGAGGFGVVYKAWDMKLENVVAVKEFFANRMVTRAEGLRNVIISKKSEEEFRYRKERFLAEARNMAMLGNHKNIPNVFEYFEENNTAYIVMELLKGLTLRDYMKQSEELVSVDFAIMLANEVGQALKSLHDRRIVHRDVAPDNIYICNGKEIKIKLMDLGAAKLADSTDDVIDIITKPGYSPVEQYDNSNNFGPWSDIYALGATLYFMLTGEKPDESTNRKEEDTLIPVNELNPMVPENLSNTIMKAMAIEKHMRFQTVDEFLLAINGEKKVVSLKKEKKRRTYQRFIGIAIALVILLVGGFKVLNEYDRQNLKADITVWIRLEEDQTEESESEKWNPIVKGFTSADISDINVTIKYIPSDEYEDTLKGALDSGEGVPDLFINPNLEEEYNEKLVDEYITCNDPLYTDGLYEDCCYTTSLALEVPVAIVSKHIKYEKNSFKDVTDFGDCKIAYDTRCKEVIANDIAVYISDELPNEKDFKEGNADVIITTTNYAADLGSEYPGGTKLVYITDGDEYDEYYIYCYPQYEMSIYNSNDNNRIYTAQEFLIYLLEKDAQEELFSYGKYIAVNKNVENDALQHVDSVQLIRREE